jgi:hypothetical protein
VDDTVRDELTVSERSLEPWKRVNEANEFRLEFLSVCRKAVRARIERVNVEDLDVERILASLDEGAHMIVLRPTPS